MKIETTKMKTKRTPRSKPIHIWAHPPISVDADPTCIPYHTAAGELVGVRGLTVCTGIFETPTWEYYYAIRGMAI